MANGVSRETFEKMPVESKLDTMFDYIKDIHIIIDARGKEHTEHIEVCMSKFRRIEKNESKRTAISAATAGAGGVIGGFAAMLAKLKIFG